MGLLNYSYKQMVKKLKKLGFSFERQCKGSHELWYSKNKDIHIILYKHGDKKTLSKGVIKEIIRDLGMTTKEFHEL